MRAVLAITAHGRLSPSSASASIFSFFSQKSRSKFALSALRFLTQMIAQVVLVQPARDFRE